MKRVVLEDDADVALLCGGSKVMSRSPSRIQFPSSADEPAENAENVVCLSPGAEDFAGHLQTRRRCPKFQVFVAERIELRSFLAASI